MQFQRGDKVKVNNDERYFHGYVGLVEEVDNGGVYWVDFDGPGGCDFSESSLELVAAVAKKEPAVTLLHGRLHRGSPESAGYDLFAAQHVWIGSGCRVKVPTGVRTKMRPNMVGLISDRSGLADRHGVTVLGGVIDADYRGEWQVIVLNTGPHPIDLETGDRVAQVVFTEAVHDVVAQDYSSVTTGPARNGGFGSTGN